MDEIAVRSLLAGANQSGVRNHNERLLLSLIQRHGALPGSDLARRSGLSAQTVSVILRSLEADGLLARGTPQKGRVGKPSVPITLNADGLFSVGMKIGRRSADLLLVDFTGAVRAQLRETYPYPMPETVLSFLERGLAKFIKAERPGARIAGLGIAAPFEIWNWHEVIGAPAADFAQWRNFDIAAAIARFTDLPVFMENDATAACRAEHVYGRGKEFRDYAYFFTGAFIGGGVVLNHSVYEGAQGNAGAFGSLPAPGPGGGPRQLIDVASLFLLEAQLAEAGHDSAQMWLSDDWSAYEPQVSAWIAQSAKELARAAVAVCAVIDFEAVLIDGGFPADVRHRLVEATRAAMGEQDARGLLLPRIEAGQVGRNARGLGAACAPVFQQYFLNTNTGFAQN